MRYIGNAIAAFDVYARPITFNIDKKTSFKTWVGGLISLVVFIFFAIFSIFLLLELIRKRDQNVISFPDTSFDDRQLIKLYRSDKEYNENKDDDNNLYFFWGLSFSVEGEAVNLGEIEKIISLKSTKINLEPLTGDSQGIRTNYGLVDCSSKFTVEDWKIDIPGNTICIDSTVEEIEGDISTEVFTYTEFSIGRCSEGDKPDGCYTGETLERKINKLKLSMVTSLSFTDTNIIGNELPVGYLDNFYYFGLNDKYTEIFDLYISKNFFESEENLLVPSVGMFRESYAAISATDRHFESPSEVYLRINVRESFFYNVDKRSYRNLFEGLAQIGGLWKMLFILGAIIAFRVNTKLLIVEVANSLYSLISPDNKDIQHETYQYHVDEFQMEGRNDLIKHMNKSALEAKMCIEYYKYERFEGIQLSLSEALLDVVACGKMNKDKKKQEILEFAENGVLNKLDLAKVFMFSLQMKAIRKLLLRDKEALLKCFSDVISTENVTTIDQYLQDKKDDARKGLDEMSKKKEAKYLEGLRGIRNKPMIYEKTDINLLKHVQIPKNWFELYFKMHIKDIGKVPNITSEEILEEDDI